MIRLVIGPSPRNIVLPESYRLEIGKGVTLCEGRDAIMFAYGPVMLNEALQTSEVLEQKGFGLKVVNMPWLNRLDLSWIENAIKPYSNVFILEDHGSVGGFGARMLEVLQAQGLLSGRKFEILGVDGYPACGTPQEVLKCHRLDGLSIAERIVCEDHK
jgi:transketolase